MKKLIVIAGPTAIGKSSLALKLAQHFAAEIFSADSRQIYQEMSIGTAKPRTNDLEKVKHHMVDIISIHDNWDVYRYEKRIIKELDQYFKINEIGILVGGTGLYINAVLNGLNEFPDVDPIILENLEKQFENEGIKSLQKELSQKDPAYYDKVDLMNPRRLIRALSIIRSTDKKFSDFQDAPLTKRSFDHINIKLISDRQDLYTRINSRVDEMMTLGLLDEAKTLLPFQHIKALQTIGYKELFDHLAGNVSLEYAVDKIKQHSRNYAKRQITWFNNNYQGTAFDTNQFKDICALLK